MKLIAEINGDKNFNLSKNKLNSTASIVFIVFNGLGEIGLIKEINLHLPNIEVENNYNESTILECFEKKYNIRIDIISEIGQIREKNNNKILNSDVYLAKYDCDDKNESKLHWKSLSNINVDLKCLIKPRDIEILKYFQSSDNDVWYKLYSKYIDKDFKNWNHYYITKMKLKRKFNKQVIKHYDKRKPVLECGCGFGKTSIFYASLGMNSYAMDLEQTMVDKTKELSRKINKNNEVKCLCGDIFNIPFKDKFFIVTHSSGVLEHFQDDEIVKIINEELRVSDYMVFSVPTKYFEKKMLGNERFMSKKEWKKIISRCNAKIVKITGYHYKTFINRMLDCIKKPRYFLKPIAMYTFVIKEDK